MNEHRASLPPMPENIRRLPVDHRGYPVPWFVAWIDGKPDHRIADQAKMIPAVKQNLCWTCGQPMGVFKSFNIGPMCAINRVISEPASHRECARFSAQACPFLSRPKARRRDSNMPEDGFRPEGMIDRNPGAICVWTCRTFTPFRAGASILFELGEPTSVDWFAEGRRAKWSEVKASIESGLPILAREAMTEDEQMLKLGGQPRAVDSLTQRVAHTLAWLKRLEWPDEAEGAPA